MYKIMNAAAFVGPCVMFYKSIDSDRSITNLLYTYCLASAVFFDPNSRYIRAQF